MSSSMRFRPIGLHSFSHPNAVCHLDQNDGQICPQRPRTSPGCGATSSPSSGGRARASGSGSASSSTCLPSSDIVRPDEIEYPLLTTPFACRMKALVFALVRAFEFELAVPPSDIMGKATIVTRPLLRSAPEQGSQMPLYIKPYNRD